MDSFVTVWFAVVLFRYRPTFFSPGQCVRFHRLNWSVRFRLFLRDAPTGKPFPMEQGTE